MISYQAVRSVLKHFATDGVVHVGVAPGSRSTPLVDVASSIWDESSIRVHFDERGLGYWAVGIGKSTNTPAIVIVTSGTAVANLLPSVIEAYYSFTPMIILAADRPNELMDVGANQSIRQTEFIRPYCRFHVDLHPPESELGVRHWLSSASVALSQLKQGTPGPIFINMRFREPLWMPGISEDFFTFKSSCLLKKPCDLRSIDAGALVLGEGVSTADLPDEINTSGIPIILDGLCGRSFDQAVCIDIMDWVSEPRFDGIEGPIVVLGRRLVSKSISNALKQYSGPIIQIADYPEWADPEFITSERIVGYPAVCARAIRYNNRSAGFVAWAMNTLAVLGGHPVWKSQWSELSAMTLIQEWIGDDTPVFVGNSMAIRLWGMTRRFGRSQRVFFNRGASGIDGLVATATGISDGIQKPVVAILGDLSLLHDLNSLSMMVTGCVIVFNNDGGGIFKHLPIRSHPNYMRYFQTPHGYQFVLIAEQFGFRYFKANSVDALADVLASIDLSQDRIFIEVQVEASNTVDHLHQLKEVTRSNV